MANHFGYTAPNLWSYLTGGKLDDFAKDYGTYQQHVSAAKAALIAQLKSEEQKLHGDLDDEGRRISGMLKAGPTDANVLALVRAGAMPLGVVDIFPGIDFSSLDMAALRNRLAALGRSGFLDPSQFPTAAAAKQLLDLMREDGVAPTDYGPLLQRYWLLVACEKAASTSTGGTPARAPTRTCPTWSRRTSTTATSTSPTPTSSGPGWPG